MGNPVKVEVMTISVKDDSRWHGMYRASEQQKFELQVKFPQGQTTYVYAPYLEARWEEIEVAPEIRKWELQVKSKTKQPLIVTLNIIV
ncbi:MAG: hypothetical protein HPY81_09655 [Firmicutes bacterium]|nr:hypothetical protein [Bacillota bacterium]